MDRLGAEAGDEAAHPDHDVLGGLDFRGDDSRDLDFRHQDAVRLARHDQIPNSENMTENAASATITRKIDSTTDWVVRRPTLSALPATLNPS